jgi:hypothetical protein
LAVLDPQQRLNKIILSTTKEKLQEIFDLLFFFHNQPYVDDAHTKRLLTKRLLDKTSPNKTSP